MLKTFAKSYFHAKKRLSLNSLQFMVKSVVLHVCPVRDK